MARNARIQIALLSITRVITNTGHRMVYPFLPVFARGLGIDIETMAIAVSVRQGFGLLTPVIGTAGDVIGRKSAILAGLAIFSIGIGVVGIWPTFPGIFAGLLVATIGRTVFEPSVFAHIAENTSASWRGAVVAISEFSWSGAYIMGVPLLGWLISRTDWLAPFPLICVSVVSIAFLVALIVPRDGSQNPLGTFQGSIRSAFAGGSSIAILIFGFLTGTALGLVAIIYGAWMEDSFGLSVSSIGLSVVAIGVAELSGEAMAALSSTLIRRRLVIGFGTLINLTAAIFLSFQVQSLFGALLGLFILFASSELSTVSRIPFLMDMVPDAKSTIVGIGSAAQRSGTAIGIFLGPIIYRAGISTNFISVVLLDLLALSVLGIFVKESGDNRTTR